MPGQDWSDRQIEQYAKRLAPKIRAAGRSADNEAELRLNVNPLLKRFAEHASLDLDETHERLIGRGRADSVYGRVVIEYEPPRSLHDRNSARANAHAIKQVQDYIEDTCKRDAQDLGRFVGVVLDGDRIIFVHHRRGDWDVGPARDVDADSVADLLLRLRALRGKALLPKNLVIDFGGQEARGKFEASAIARQNVAALYKALAASESPKVDALFAQWRLLFSEVCGYEFGSPKLDLEGLAASYDVALKKPARATRRAGPVGAEASAKAAPRPAQGRTPQAEMLFFAIHTYYATVITLLAAEIVTFYTSDITPSYLGKLEAAPGPRLGEELRDLHETGGIFGQALVQNFLEGDFFGWYLEEWNDSIAAAVRAIIVALRQYDASTFQVEPDQTRDLLKKLYQYLLPKKLRHDLGEYYTPDWLAELVLNEVGYDGDLTKRILDPACGSGTFLALEIRRAKQWAQEKPWGERETLDGILASVVGFDLNPLAVITARTNYLIALGDLLRHRRGPIEIPVYLCDAVLTPTTARQLALGERVALETSVAAFLVPLSVATQEGMASLASVLEEAVRGGYSRDEFVSRAATEIPLHNDDPSELLSSLGELYDQLAEVDRQGRNGIWARIIKNFFAPVFAVAERRFDYVVGNPPWINWQTLPDGYRRSTARVWADYGMAPRVRAKGSQFDLGSVKRDLSALFTYVAADRYLEDGCGLAFLVTESLFKASGAAQSFRQMELPAKPGHSRTGLRVVRAHDLVQLKPFEGASNRTAALIVQKGHRTTYPVEYVVWRRRKGAAFEDSASLDYVEGCTEREVHAAKPVRDRKGAAWITGPSAVLEIVDRMSGVSRLKAWAGVCTWMNGVYWVRVTDRLPDDQLMIANMADTGRSSVAQTAARVEAALVRPLLRGRDIRPWSASPTAHIVLPHSSETGWQAIPETEMRTQYPLTLKYLARFKADLLARSGYKQLRSGHPFYIVGNTGDRTFVQNKVVWPGEVAASLRAAAITAGQGDVAIPDQTVYFITAANPSEAHFLAGLLNSAPLALYYSMRAYKHTSMTFVNDVRIPRFDHTSAQHLRLSDLSQAAHEAAARADDKRVAEIEAEVDEAAAELWGLTPKELAIIQKALREK